MLGARELVGPIIAMTITLAAVYAPIGFQGGLTGSLFREFAFTLAGAVMISGVVALTLSPMMSSKLVDAPSGRGTGLGPAQSIAPSTASAIPTAACSTGRCASRPAVYTVWIVPDAAVLPMFIMFSPQELAPTEDQGVVFGIVEAPANATIEQTQAYAEEGRQDVS